MWQEDLARNIKTADEIVGRLGASEKDAELIGKVCARYPVSVTEYYFDLINPDDPDDPISRIALPHIEELEESGEIYSGGEDVNTKIPGLQHKYGSTALLLTSDVCACYCRFCFRKRMVGMSESEACNDLSAACEYIARHPEINNVILSGGDGLMNSNDVLRHNFEMLGKLDQLEFIRIASRTPVVFPQRIYDDPELLDMLAEVAKRRQVYMVTHFNHHREFTPESKRAIDCLKKAGIALRNQTVLLAGVNDSFDALRRTLMGLANWGISPYYVFQCRPVRGVHGIFQVPLRSGIDLVETVKGSLPGISKQFRFVMSHGMGKIEILGLVGNGNTALFKFHRAKEPENNGLIFTEPIDDQQTWITIDGMV
ncbi:MAG: KamA family radical SAM protein [Coriobacteriales bacterium]|nr:KamA family radical SAM protein [Coriobacteriales bacterium]